MHVVWKENKICKVRADVPLCCPDLSADSLVLTTFPSSELPWIFYSSCSIITWQEIKSFLWRTAKRDRLSLQTEFIWPSASSAISWEASREGQGRGTGCGIPCSGAASDTAAAPLLSMSCGRHPRAELILVFRSICGHLAELCVQSRPSHTAQMGGNWAWVSVSWVHSQYTII